MNFCDGDTITGASGSTWTREGGEWWLPSKGQPISDETALWMLNFRSRVTAVHRVAKISKSGSDHVSIEEYRWMLAQR